MKYTWIDAFLMEKLGVMKDLQEDWNWIRYQIVFGSLSKKKQKEILDMSEENGLISCCGSDCSACYCYGDIRGRVPEDCGGKGKET